MHLFFYLHYKYTIICHGLPNNVRYITIFYQKNIQFVSTINILPLSFMLSPLDFSNPLAFFIICIPFYVCYCFSLSLSYISNKHKKLCFSIPLLALHYFLHFQSILTYHLKTTTPLHYKGYKPIFQPKYSLSANILSSYIG